SSKLTLIKTIALPQQAEGEGSQRGKDKSVTLQRKHSEVLLRAPVADTGEVSVWLDWLHVLARSCESLVLG
ncbi:MAG: hypothetical protein AAGA03_14480, partial [Planctomycetota bacterium]